MPKARTFHCAVNSHCNAATSRHIIQLCTSFIKTSFLHTTTVDVTASVFWHKVSHHVDIVDKFSFGKKVEKYIYRVIWKIFNK